MKGRNGKQAGREVIPTPDSVRKLFRIIFYYIQKRISTFFREKFSKIWNFFERVMKTGTDIVEICRFINISGTFVPQNAAEKERPVFHRASGSG